MVLHAHGACAPAHEAALAPVAAHEAAVAAVPERAPQRPVLTAWRAAQVLSTALFDKPAFKNVIVNGLVLASDGKKMSKRLKNYPDPELVINAHGADALRSPPPPFPRTNRTSLVPPLVLSGHAASLTGSTSSTRRSCAQRSSALRRRWVFPLPGILLFTCVGL